MKNPERHHRWKHDPSQAFETCPVCARDKRVCEKKIRFASYVEADEWVYDFNITRGWSPPLMTRYPCRWCAGWHMKTAKDKHERVRMQRQFRKWVIRTVDQDRADDGGRLLHWVRTGEVLRTFVRGNDVIDQLATDPLAEPSTIGEDGP